MEKRIVFYCLLEPNSFWPKVFREKFKNSLSKHGVMSFLDGAREESEFLNLAIKAGIKISPKKQLSKLQVMTYITIHSIILLFKMTVSMEMRILWTLLRLVREMVIYFVK